MSPSAWLGGRAHAVLYTHSFLNHLERLGVRVVNGSRAYVTETSKALQLSLLERLGLPYPRARGIHHASQAPAAATGLRCPVVGKPNIGGGGGGGRRWRGPERLADAAAR